MPPSPLYVPVFPCPPPPRLLPQRWLRRWMRGEGVGVHTRTLSAEQQQRARPPHTRLCYLTALIAPSPPHQTHLRYVTAPGTQVRLPLSLSPT